MNLYQIFDALVASEVEIPELPTGGQGQATMTVRMGLPRNFRDPEFQTTFEWRDRNGTTFCLCRRWREEYLLDFPRLGQFHVTPQGVIHCMPRDGADWPTCRYLLLNWVLPRYLGTSGQLIVHAGAVTLATGKTMAFMGNTGFGKSTLVGSFLGHEARLVDDDCLLVQPRQDGVWAIGSYPGIRLFPDSVAAVFGQDAGFAGYTPYMDKQQLLLDRESSERTPGWHCLSALFLLNDPVQAPSDEVGIRPASGPDVAMAMLRGAFSLDPMDRETMAGTFRRTGAAIDEGVRVFELAYPREHARLQEVRQAVGELLVSG